MSRILFYLAVIALGVLMVNLAGCVNLGQGTGSPKRFYTLNSMASNLIKQPIEETRHDVYLGIGLIKLPKYLNRPQIVTRKSQNQIQVSEFQKSKI